MAILADLWYNIRANPVTGQEPVAKKSYIEYDTTVPWSIVCYWVGTRNWQLHGTFFIQQGTTMSANERLVKVVEFATFIGAFTVFVASLVLMLGTALDRGDPYTTYSLLGLLGVTLMRLGFLLKDMIRYKPKYTKLSDMFSKAVGWFDYSFLNFDILSFPVGKGELSEVIIPELHHPSTKKSPPPPALVTIPKINWVPEPKPVPKPVHTPGFIYVMRRDDGIYKFGKTINPNQRLIEHTEDYEKNFTLVRCFTVPDMTIFERLALKMTKQYTYGKEKGRKELRRMNRRQLSEFLTQFEAVIRRTYDNQS